MGFFENNGTPKSSILIGFSIINHPFWGAPIFGNIHIGTGIFFQFLNLELSQIKDLFRGDGSGSGACGEIEALT